MGPARIVLGPRVRFGNGAVLDARGGGIEIDAGAWIGAGVTVLAGDAGLLESGANPSPRNVRIGPNACLEVGALVLPGATVGAGAIVAAGAVVNVDVPAYAVVAGAPLRVIGRRLPETSCLEFYPPCDHRLLDGHV